MSKKVILIVALFSAFVGGASSYLIQKTFGSQVSKVISVAEQVPSHFTSNSSSAEYPDLTYAAEKTVPTVVGIEKRISARRSQNEYYGGDISPFLEMFGFRGQIPQQREPQDQRSGGSGVIISEDGYIVTNNHVVEDADQLFVTLDNGKRIPAKLIGTDPTTDIALIKIDEKGLPFTTFGDSEKLRLGEWVIAVGNPYGLNSTVTAGIVSAKGRNLDVIPSQFRIEAFIQTDAAVNPGNSGGALVNASGELIGINTVIKSPTGSYAGYSFAVPSSIVKKVIVDLMEYGLVQRAMLGIQYNEINEAFIEAKAKELGVKEKSGLYVAEVTEGGAAEAAGIKKGDVLFELNGIAINGSPALQEQIAKNRPGESVNVGIKRDGTVKHFDVVLRNKAGETKLLEKNSVDIVSFLGGEFAELSDKAKKELKINSGVQIVKIGNGMLAKGGVKAGYIITHINGKEIRSVGDLDRFTDKVEVIDGLYPNGKYISYSIINGQ
ncbi:MAG: trypsin-like peptidase domain-containing protein [Rikenellaceae bacterium]